jgi:starch synthase
MTASEMTPFAKTGGLADVIGSLPKALNQEGDIEIITMIPKYGVIDDSKYGLKEMPEIIWFYMSGRAHGILLKYVEFSEGWKAYFVENIEYLTRDGLYGYYDDGMRFAFFARAVLEAVKGLGFRPDVIHCNDWHSGLTPAYLKTMYNADPFFQHTKTLFTVHNLAYQGVFSKELLPALDIGWEEFKVEKLEFWDSINYLKAGLAYSDSISTVSKRYSEEIQTPHYGEHLDGILRDRRDVLYGIDNGIDYQVWNPATDQSIAQNYDASNLDKRIENKIALQKENNLTPDPKIPLAGVVSRLTHQKGLDIILDAIYDMVHMGIQLVILGTGDEYYQDRLRWVAYEYSGQVGVNIIFDEDIARHIYAGSDIFLMPSRYEPCGLGQLIAMRYGSIPIVRKTGGLADTVKDYNPVTERGTGFSFHDEWSPALLEAIGKAMSIYNDKEQWRGIIHNAMESDFSWANSAREYLDLYNKILQNHIG